MRPYPWLLTALILSAAFLVFAPQIHQDPSYHHFADSRTFWGIPNFWNVLSNLAFLPVGIAGLVKAREWWARVLFTGILAVTFGSGYYHWTPSDESLFWDRLPMTLVFMALTARAIEMWAARNLLWPLTAFGIASAWWWHATGDLRPYAVAQFGPFLILLPAAVAVTGLRMLSPAILLYILAKIAEFADSGIYQHMPLSGHTLKHFLAAFATYWIYRWSFTSSATASPKHGPLPEKTAIVG